MATTMTLQPLPTGSSLETRPSLLKRLQSGDDAQSWKAPPLPIPLLHSDWRKGCWKGDNTRALARLQAFS